MVSTRPVANVSCAALQTEPVSTPPPPRSTSVAPECCCCLPMKQTRQPSTPLEPVGCFCVLTVFTVQRSTRFRWVCFPTVTSVRPRRARTRYPIFELNSDLCIVLSNVRCLRFPSVPSSCTMVANRHHRTRTFHHGPAARGPHSRRTPNQLRRCVFDYSKKVPGDCLLRLTLVLRSSANQEFACFL